MTVLPRMIAKAMRSILLASATATSLKGLFLISLFAHIRSTEALNRLSQPFT